MIRSRVEEEEPDELGDDEEEDEDENEAPCARHEPAAEAPRGRGSAGPGGLKPLTRADSFTAQTQVQSAGLGPPRRVLARRSSSVVANRQPPTSEAGRVAGGDSSLRPRFLKERSATLVDLVSEPLNPARVPQSKASAFLLSVLAKARGSSTFESKRAALEPLRGGTNTLGYTSLGQKEHGTPLRASGRQNRRQGHSMLAMSAKGASDQGSALAGEDHQDAGRKGPVALVRDLQIHRQQLPRQLGALQSILHYIHTRGGEDGEMVLYKEMVDEGLINELATAMREFRFHTGLQVCVVSILSVLAEASLLYAYMMSEIDLDKLLTKTAAVHSSQERLVMLASTVVHAIEDSKVNFNVQAYRAEKSAKVRQQSALCAKEVVAQFSSKLKPFTRRTSRSASEMVADALAERSVVSSASGAMVSSRSQRGGRPRALSQSASRIRQAFAANVTPPVLGTNYRLHFAQPIKKAEIPPLPRILTPDQGDSDSELIGFASRPQRPATSPSRTPLRLELPPDSLTAAAYLDMPVFVEPSPLSKRLPNRGTCSAGGIRRRLNSQKRLTRANTGRLTPPELFDLRSPSAASTSEIEPSSTAKVRHPGIDETGMISTNQEEELLSESSVFPASTNQEEKIKCEPKGVVDAEEAYEDDFDGGNETKDERKSIGQDDNRILGSDGELIDMLHEISVRDGGATTNGVSTETPLVLPVLSESQAAINIQRHVRGSLARRRMQLQSHSTTSELQKQRPDRPTHVANRKAKSRKAERRLRREVRGYQSRTPSARPHRLRRSIMSGDKRARLSSSELAPRTAERMTSTQQPGKQPHHSIPSVSGGQARGRADRQKKSKPKKTRELSESAKKVSHEGSVENVGMETGPECGEDCPQEKEQPVQKLLGPEALKRIQDLYAEGLQHHQENRLGLAIDCYEAALRVPAADGRQFASLHVNLGSALMTQHKFPQALAAFEQAERIQPNNIKAIYNSALALLNLTRPKEALRQLQRVLELEPAHEKAKYALSHIETSASSPPRASGSNGRKEEH